jgi:vacuolar-type H+-ATPase subunit H
LALDRQSIEKRDFPIGRRGYEPEAVDEHLARLAGEVEALRRQSERRSPESLAAVASQQVASIVQAAETTAGDLEREARDEAERIRREAESDAASTRDEAVKRSQNHIQRVSEAAQQMLQRIDAMQGELTAITESLRTGGNRLQADLSLLEGSMRELFDTGGRSSGRLEAVSSEARVREVPPPPRPSAAPPEPVAAVEPEPEERLQEAPPAPPAPEPARAEPSDSVDDDDVEGARLIALNMALNGTPREETSRYLEENFDLEDQATILDEVYARVGG